MRRRYVIRGGVVMGLGSLAGCIVEDIGDIADRSDGATDTEPEDDADPEPSDGSEDGDLSFTVEPSASEIKWGEPYSVTVTVSAENGPSGVATGVTWKKGSESSWSGPLSDTVKQWQIGAGESQTETFEIKFGSAGEYTLGLARVGTESVIEEWDLTVTPPTAEFGETISYYNGLEMTVDAELHEWLELQLSWEGGDETGTYPVRPRNGQWVKVLVEGVNNSDENKDLTAPAGGDFSALADGSPLNQIGSGGESVGADTDYEIDDPTREEKGAKMDIKEAYWFPPGQGFTRGTLVPNATHEGMLLFETDMDTTKADLRIQLKFNDILATWK